MSLKIWVLKDELTSDDLNANFADVLDAAVYNEDLTAYTNGSDVTFDTVNLFKPGTLRVYLSSGPSTEMYRKQRGTGPSVGDYVEVLNTDGNGESFRFNSITPASTAKLVVDYERALP